MSVDPSLLALLKVLRELDEDGALELAYDIQLHEPPGEHLSAWRALGYPVELPEDVGVDEDGRAVYPPPWGQRSSGDF